METMTLHLEDIRIETSMKPGTFRADGILYVSIGDACFPDRTWFDLVSADFEIWLPRLISFGNGHTDSCTLPFLDGPFQMELVRKTNGSATVCCLQDGKISASETEIDLPDFLESAASCVRKLARAIYEAYPSGQMAQTIAEYGALAGQLRRCTGV